MFVGRPPGNYDRLLDFSSPVTGSLFFVPTATFLDNISPDDPNAEPASAPDISSLKPDNPPDLSDSSGPGTSLRIGSLKGEKNE